MAPQRQYVKSIQTMCEDAESSTVNQARAQLQHLFAQKMPMQHWSGDLQPLPPACHLIDADQEASEQIPQTIEEARQDIGQTQVSCHVHAHNPVEDHQIERAVNDEQIPAHQIGYVRPGRHDYQHVITRSTLQSRSISCRQARQA